VDERETPHETDLLESVAPAIGPAIMMSAAGECLYSALDAAGITDVDRGNFKPERRRGRLDDRELSDPLWNCRITQHGRSRGARRNLLEQLQPFRASAVFQLGKSCGVAPWPRNACDKSGRDRIGVCVRHSLGRLQERPHAPRAFSCPPSPCSGSARPPAPDRRRASSRCPLSKPHPP
jgi:hypothetical protein